MLSPDRKPRYNAFLSLSHSPPVPPAEADPLDEAKLIRECKRGSLESFEPLVRRYQARLGTIAYHILRDESLADEAVQLTFVKAWQKMRRFRGECSFGTWLHRLCVNTSWDLLRARSRQREASLPTTEDENGRVLLDDLLKSEASPDRETLNRELKNLILQALAKLPEEQRIVLILREMQGLDYREIAKTIKCRKGTAMSRLFHARRKLRQLLEKIL